MFKNFKSVSMLLFLSAIGGGTVYAVSGESVTGIDAIQQKGTCTGIVKDATGEPIIGATVMVKGTTNGTITGLDGDFSLNNVEKGSILQVSFVGYQTLEVEWKGTPLNVTLKEDTQLLDEVTSNWDFKQYIHLIRIIFRGGDFMWLRK